MLVAGFKIDDTFYSQGFDLREFTYQTECKVVDVIEVQIVLRPGKNASLGLEYLGKDHQGQVYYIHPERSRFIPKAEEFGFKRCGEVFLSQAFPVESTPSGFRERIETVVNSVLRDRQVL